MFRIVFICVLLIVFVFNVPFQFAYFPAEEKDRIGKP